MAMSRRSAAALLVICAWGAALAWLGMRRLGTTDASRISQQAALRLAPGDAWFRVMAGGMQVGYGGITLDTLADGSYRIREQLSTELPGDRGLSRAIRSSTWYLGTTLAVDSMSSRYTSATRVSLLTVLARRGRWEVERSGPGLPTARGTVALDQPGGGVLAPLPVSAATLRLGLVGAIASGAERTVTLAAGWPPAIGSGAAEPASDTVVAYTDSSEVDPVTRHWVGVSRDTTEARVLYLETPIGPRRLVIDARGTVLALQAPFGVRWLREDFNIARFNFRAGLDTSGATLQASLPTMRPLFGSPWLADTSEVDRRWVVTHRDGRPIDPALLERMVGFRQRLRAPDTLIVMPRPLGNPETFTIADPFIQADDSAVAALAAEVRPHLDQGDEAAVMQRLRARVRIDTAWSAPDDAAGALRAGRASIDGLARLAVAVFRAGGIRARRVVGVLPVGDTLYTHSWVEWDRGRGVRGSVDPVTGRRPASQLIRLGVGGSSRPDDLWLELADVRFSPVAPRQHEGDGT